MCFQITESRCANCFISSGFLEIGMLFDSLFLSNFNWTTMWKNLISDVCPATLKSACASVQPDQSFSCLREKTLHHWVHVSEIRLVMILMRRILLGAHVRRYIFWRCGSVIFSFEDSLKKSRRLSHISNMRSREKMFRRWGWELQNSSLELSDLRLWSIPGSKI